MPHELKRHLDKGTVERVFVEWRGYVGILPDVLGLATQRILHDRYILYTLVRSL